MVKKKKLPQVYVHMILFFIVSLLFVLGFNYPNVCFARSDFSFHYERLNGLIEALRSGVLKAFVYYGNYKYGYAVAAYYPDLLMLPFAALGFFGVQTVTILRMFLVVVKFLEFCIAYFGYDDIFHDKKNALLFSAFYGLSGAAGQQMIHFALGRILVHAFFPLIINGVYHIVYCKDKPHILYLGLILIAYSNIVFLFVVGLALIVYIVIRHRDVFSDRRIVAGFFVSGILAVCCSAVAWMPFLTDFIGIGNQLYVYTSETKHIGESFYLFFTIISVMLPSLVSDYTVWLHNFQSSSFYMFAAFVVFLAYICIMWFIHKRSSYKKKKAVMLLITCLYLWSEFFPWIYLGPVYDFVLRIELFFRLAVIVDIVLAYLVIDFWDKYNTILLSWLLASSLSGVLFACATFITLENSYDIPIEPGKLTDDYIESVKPYDVNPGYHAGNGLLICSKYGVDFEYFIREYSEYLWKCQDRFSDKSRWYYAVDYDLIEIDEYKQPVEFDRTDKFGVFKAYLDKDHTVVPLIDYTGYKVFDENGVFYGHKTTDYGFIDCDITEPRWYYIKLGYTLPQILSFILFGLGAFGILFYILKERRRKWLL